ncbi:hypothetical protein D3C71_1701680 [compost metagenome]
MLRYRHRNAGNIRFLECVRADQAGEDVAGNYHQRNRVHISRRNTGDQVRCARTGSGDTDAYLAARSCVTVRCMNGSLLMPGQHMVEIRKSIERIVNIQNGAARISEHGIDTLQHQAAEQNFRAGNHFRRLPFLPQFLRRPCFRYLRHHSVILLAICQSSITNDDRHFHQNVPAHNKKPFAPH